jgi:fatty-acyl-CoA synthase
MRGVQECAVVGLPDERWGEVPVAALVPAPGAAITEASVLAHLSGRIAKFKLPRRVVLLDSLPKSALGKVVKGEVVRALGGTR